MIELIQAIALLCLTPSNSSTPTVRTIQLKCQTDIILCIKAREKLAKKRKSPKINYGKALWACH